MRIFRWPVLASLAGHGLVLAAIVAFDPGPPEPQPKPVEIAMAAPPESLEALTLKADATPAVQPQAAQERLAVYPTGAPNVWVEVRRAGHGDLVARESFRTGEAGQGKLGAREAGRSLEHECTTCALDGHGSRLPPCGRSSALAPGKVRSSDIAIMLFQIEWHQIK